MCDSAADNEVFYGKNFTIVSISPGASDWFVGTEYETTHFVVLE